MKKGIIFFVIVMLSIGCKKEESIKEPKKLIEKSVMVNIFYDLAILEASKYQMLSNTEYEKVSPREFIFKKYKIDSAQFSQNNIYYAHSIEEYKTMFEQVQKRLQVNSDKMDTLIKRKQKKLEKEGKKRRPHSESKAERMAR